LQKPRRDLSDFGHVQDVHRVELIVTLVPSGPLWAAHPKSKEKEKEKVKMFVIVVTADILLVTIAVFQLRNNIHFFVLCRACLCVCHCYQAECLQLGSCLFYAHNGNVSYFVFTINYYYCYYYYYC